MGFPHKNKWHPASGNFGIFGATRGSRSAKKAKKRIDETIQLLILKYKHKIKNLVEIKGSTKERIKSVKLAVLS